MIEKLISITVPNTLILAMNTFGTVTPYSNLGGQTGSKRHFLSFEDLKREKWLFPGQQTPVSQSPCDVLVICVLQYYIFVSCQQAREAMALLPNNQVTLDGRKKADIDSLEAPCLLYLEHTQCKGLAWWRVQSHRQLQKRSEWPIYPIIASQPMRLSR